MDDTTDAQQATPAEALPCPRCGGPLFDGPNPARYFGPCADCREQLRQTLKGETAETEVAEYEPKMNVTPNAVALKDD